MAVQAFVKIKGAKQGQFKGEGVQKPGAGGGSVPLVRFVSAGAAPRDAATGQASGKRQWQPVRITKEWGAASPQLVQAMTTNEILPSVVFEFFRPDKTGKEQLHYRITLQNATVASISSTFDPTGELEDVEFTFQSIKVEDIAGSTVASDNWQEVAPQPQQPVPPVLREPIRPVLPAQ